MKVTVFLRTPLFAISGSDAHVPQGALVIEGEVEERPSGGLRIATSTFRDDRGAVKGEQKCTLLVPWSKIDHVLEHEA